MSTYYLIYAEANVDGKWYSLCPYFRIGREKTKAHDIFWAQSRFYDVNNDLEAYALGHGIPDDMSDGLRECFRENLQEEAEHRGNHVITWAEYYRSTVYWVNFAQAVVPRVKKDRPYKYEGYVLKNELAAYEVNEQDDFSEWLTQDEYDALTEKRKRQYIFHRWNDSWGDYEIYQAIAERVWVLAGLFADACADDIGGSLYNGITDSQIRLYVYRC